MQKVYGCVIYVTVCLGWVSFSEESQDSSQQSYSPHHKGTNLYAKSALYKKINLPLRLLIECLINNFTVFVGMHLNCNNVTIFISTHTGCKLCPAVVWNPGSLTAHWTLHSDYCLGQELQNFPCWLWIEVLQWSQGWWSVMEGVELKVSYLSSFICSLRIQLLSALEPRFFSYSSYVYMPA